MKKQLNVFAALAILFVFSFSSCDKVKPDEDKTTPQQDNETQETGGNTESGKTLIVFYSYTGNCTEIVSALSSNIEADVLQVKEVNEGADYNASNYQYGADLINAINRAPDQASCYPAIKDVDKKAEDYDTIIVVTPLWHSRMAAIMQTYLFRNGAKMSGKNIGLVVSSASSGISGVESDARRLVPEGKFLGTSLWINNSNRSKRAGLVKEWVESNKI